MNFYLIFFCYLKLVLHVFDFTIPCLLYGIFDPLVDHEGAIRDGGLLVLLRVDGHPQWSAVLFLSVTFVRTSRFDHFNLHSLGLRLLFVLSGRAVEAMCGDEGVDLPRVDGEGQVVHCLLSRINI